MGMKARDEMTFLISGVNSHVSRDEMQTKHPSGKEVIDCRMTPLVLGEADHHSEFDIRS